VIARGLPARRIAGAAPMFAGHGRMEMPSEQPPETQIFAQPPHYYYFNRKIIFWRESIMTAGRARP
jgi:hypothetical protein